MEVWEKTLNKIEKKKIVITKLKRELFFEGAEEENCEFLVVAAYEQDKLSDLNCYSLKEDSILGNIYIGRVENIVKNLNAAFIRFSEKEKGYYSLENFKAPIFTKKIGKKPLCIGDELLVQVEREAIKTKDPYLSTNLNFSGEYLVLTGGDKKVGVSAKLDKETKKRLKELLELHKKDEYGVIVRTNANSASDSEILQELEKLEKDFFHLKETAIHKTCYSLLYQPQKGISKILQDLRLNTLEEIVTDDASFYQLISSEFDKNKNFTGKIRYYEDALLPLYKLYSIESEIRNALRKKVWLKSGAYLIIEPTEALTVIDVNSGKNVTKKKSEESFLKINLEAAKEIARQLRIRNISGVCIIDFISMESKESNETLMHEFRMELKKDPVGVQLVDITKLGLVELTRKKVKKSLKEQFSFGKSIDE